MIVKQNEHLEYSRILTNKRHQDPKTKGINYDTYWMLKVTKRHRNKLRQVKEGENIQECY